MCDLARELRLLRDGFSSIGRLDERSNGPSSGEIVVGEEAQCVVGSGKERLGPHPEDPRRAFGSSPLLIEVLAAFS